MLSFGRIFQLMLMLFLLTVPAVLPLSIVKYVPMEEESYTNTIYRKAYNLVPGLKRLRAKSPAEGKDFVSAVDFVCLTKEIQRNQQNFSQCRIVKIFQLRDQNYHLEFTITQ